MGGSSLCSEYGFAEKVVEGMFIVVNSITIKIHSKAFHASFELWQLQGYSVNPNWQQSDLRFTRITDPQRGEVSPCFCTGSEKKSVMNDFSLFHFMSSECLGFFLNP